MGTVTTDRVEVRNRFNGNWSRGYAVEEVVLTGAKPAYRLRRCSDGAVLPRLFLEDEVRRQPPEAYVVDWAMAPSE